MRILFLMVFFCVSVVALAQSCPKGQVWNDCSGPQFGPGSCVPGCVGVAESPTEGPTGPAELCFQESCNPVRYTWIGTLVVAESLLPNGYAVMGWSGPCLDLNQQCPDILNQAFADLRMNALRVNRAQRYEY